MPKHATLDGTGKVPSAQLPDGVTLPSQTGNNGKYLTTNGTTTSWGAVSGSATWGGITGTLSTQTDLQSALDGKSSTSHNHSGVYQPLATVLTNTTASFTTAQETKLSGITGVNTGDQIITTVEKDLGITPVSNGSFTIAGAFTVGKPILVNQGPGPYTGKGTLTDEVEMDQLTVACYVLDASTIQCNWGSSTMVRGNVKFNYMVSA